jgi:hypothetical protein
MGPVHYGSTVLYVNFSPPNSIAVNSFFVSVPSFLFLFFVGGSSLLSMYLIFFCSQNHVTVASTPCPDILLEPTIIQFISRQGIIFFKLKQCKLCVLLSNLHVSWGQAEVL